LYWSKSENLRKEKEGVPSVALAKEGDSDILHGAIDNQRLTIDKKGRKESAKRGCFEIEKVK
jgi:hypothetical protein